VDGTTSAHISDFSDETTIDIGPFVEGAQSLPVMGTPSATLPYPDLPDEGCFVATAAFGADWEAEVEVLRDFRDAYLVTHRAGRRFVHWYYRNGPVAADLIDRYAFMKPVTRALLTPLVVVSLFLLNAPPAAVFAIGVLLIMLVSSALWRRFARVMR
jgi:hypothetical protein